MPPPVLTTTWPGGIGAPGMKSPDFSIGGGRRKNRSRKNRSRKNRSLKKYKNKSS